MLPRVSKLHRDATHRLIPAKYTDRDDSVLTRLTGDVDDLKALFELEGAANDRLLGEAGLLPGVTVHELVFGVPHAHIVNAAFTHPRPTGGRFNGPERACWYAGFSRETSAIEVAWRRSVELREINWQEPEAFEYADFIADFRGEFHDIRNDARFRSALNPSSPTASQKLAAQLLEAGSPGIVYPSVRHKKGTCVACFRPALVTNVRKDRSMSVSFENAQAPPVFAKCPDE